MTAARENDRVVALSPERRALVAHALGARNARASATTVRPNPAERFSPFPLTALQQAYLIGRSDAFALGNVASCAYLEIDAGALDRARFEAAWNQLIRRHDMLRAIVLNDGSQQVLEMVPWYQVGVTDVRGAPSVEAARQVIREEMVGALAPADQWPLFALRLSVDDAGVHIHLTLDLLTADAGSIAILFRDLAALYGNPGIALPPIDLTFRDYVLAERAASDSPQRSRAEEYWRARLGVIVPGPDLPLAVDPSSLDRPRFVRRLAQLSPVETEALKLQAASAGISLSTVLLGVYAEVLGRWSQDSRFTINIPMFNRAPVHPDIDRVVGAFTSVELLTIDTAPASSLRERFRAIQEQLLEDLDHREYDGVEVMRDLRNAGREARMPVVFTSLVDVRYHENISDIGIITDSVNHTAQVWMDLHVDEQAGELLVKWDAVDGLFPPGMLEDMLAGYVEALHALATDPGAWERVDLPLLPAAQVETRRRLNATWAPEPESTIQDYVWSHADERPGAPAVIVPGLTMSFGELKARASALAAEIRDLGVQRHQLVAIVMEKGAEQVVAAYAVLMSGAAYVPIDPGSPPKRLRQLLESSAPTAVLTQPWLDERLDWPGDIRRLAVDATRPAPTRESNAMSGPEPRDLAYVMYTSGSTGQPKGVMIEHRSVVNRLLDVNRRLGIDAEDRALGLSAMHHDLSVYDMFGMLMAGGAVVFPSANDRMDPAHWLEVANAAGVTFLNAVPAFVEMLVEYLESAPGAAERFHAPLRKIVMSGDWIPPQLIPRLRSLFPDVEIVSAGGPTETTVWDICHPLGALEPGWPSVPYGRPMTNAHYYVLDKHLRDRPDWVPGELHIGGTGLARGYWGDEQRTAASFIHHPVTGERLYRSGDIGRIRPGGVIEFLGRADFQVKIQGQRIELGEIEAMLLQHEAIVAAVATVQEIAGKRVLVGYVVAGPAGRIDLDDVRRFVTDRLPGHMVPRHLVVLDRLPLSANGKVDRRILPAPDEATATAQGDPGGPNPQANAVAAIVAEVLGAEAVDPQDDLLALGATSLDMVRIGNRLEARFGVRPRIDELFRLRTVSALASHFGPAAPVAQLQPAGEPAAANYHIILDPGEVAAFKARKLGIRTAGPGEATVPLSSGDAEQHAARCTARKSCRQFSLQPVSREQFSGLLRSTAPVHLNGELKYAYASPGGTYAVQIYVHVKPGRVEGVPPGIHYYHPLRQELITIAPGAMIERDIHIPFINQPTFDECAFSIFLVARLDAIGPVYGEHALRFSTIEAGILAHTLELGAAESGLGLCQVGSIDFEQVRPLFRLEPDHLLIHSLLGGRPASEPSSNGWNADDRLSRLADRIQELTPAQVRELLDANREAGS